MQGSAQGEVNRGQRMMDVGSNQGRLAEAFQTAKCSIPKSALSFGLLRFPRQELFEFAAEPQGDMGHVR